MSSFRIRRRSSPIVAILLATAVLAGVLTYQAWEADHYHRTAAARAIRDYADFAAWEFAAAAKEDLYRTLVEVLSPVRREQPIRNGGALPPPGVLSHEGANRVMCADRPRYFFRLDLATQSLALEGAPVSEAMQRWIRDTIRADLVNYKKDWTYSSLAGTIDGAPGTIVYQLKYDDRWRPRAAYGMEICVNALAAPSFARAMQSHTILPPSLTQMRPNDSLMSVLVYDAAGREIWRTQNQYPGRQMGVAHFPYMGGFLAKVALNPEHTGDLLIGGIPRSRVPVLLAILTLTLLLTGIGVVQLRREDELARLRSDFIASVSHELRTPLAQLRMFAETLLLGRVRSEHEQRRSLEIVDQEARRLSHLVENILQFSRAERHGIKLAPTDAVLAPHVHAAIETFEPIARARHVQVVADVDDCARSVVDTGALRQILLNLLDNAVKYGPAEQDVRVTVNGERTGAWTRITVDDAGPGIPHDKRAKVWEPFYRLDRDADSAVAGSGIGLSVVRELVARHGGRVSIETAPSGGARFVIDLPSSKGGQ